MPAGRSILKVNLDETAVCIFQGGAKGNVLLSKRHLRGHRLVQKVPRGRTRTYLTHVAFICDQPEIQAVLPQFVIGNEATLPAAMMPSLRAACPNFVHLVRQKSAWNNQVLCATIVRTLALALRPYLGAFQPVLLLDTVRFHFADLVLNACCRWQIWLLFVPAKTTWLLQALDTHVFMAFKSFLAKAYQQARIDAGRMDLSISQFLPCLYKAMQEVLLNRAWGVAFEKNGFGRGQENVSARILQELGLDLPLQVSMDRPSLEDLRSVFPARTVIPEAALWRQLQIGPVAKAAAKASAEPLVVAGRKGLVGQVPLLGRTRGEHRRAMVAQSHAGSSSAGSSEALAAAPVVARASRLAWRPKQKAKAVVEIL